MRLSGAFSGIFFLTAVGVLTPGASLSEAPATSESPSSGEESPPPPPEEPVEKQPDGEGSEQPSPETRAPAVPSPPSRVVAPEAATQAPRPTERHEVLELPEPSLPEDVPLSSNNELTAALGWNSDTPVGLRYLRRVEGTAVSFGLGLGLVTMWGPKLSAVVRLQPSFEQGFFAQVSAGYSLGGSFTAQVAPTGQSAQTAHLVRTPSRTADVMVGWRLPLSSNFLEASAGYSFNLQGTVLQEQVVDGQVNRAQVPLDLSSIPFNRAGGPAGAVAYGWLF